MLSEAYGNLLHAPVASLLQTNPWRFASGYFDSATGFTKFGVRYYDATTGRWTQQDPKAGSVFDARSSNRYVYAKCDPVNVVDPGGKAGWYITFGTCLASAVMAPLFAISGAITGIGAIGLGAYALAGTAAAAAGETVVTAPAWLTVATLVGAGLFFGVVIACAGVAFTHSN